MRITRSVHGWLAVVLVATACGPAGDASSTDDAAAAGGDAGVVDVVARDYAFIGPAEIPSGWITFRFTNEGAEPHFMLLARMPAGKTQADYAVDVPPAFDAAWQVVREGGTVGDALQILVQGLPAWSADIVWSGGPGFVSPGEFVETTVYLEPGDYAVECYVKTPDGVFHNMIGMSSPLKVTGDDSGHSPPAADIDIRVDNSGMRVEGTPVAGGQTVAVHFDEHPAGGLGNDVHVARLDEDADLEAVFAWMSWLAPEGLVPPGPATWVGGAHEAPVGQTAYFTLDLEPGRYAWVGESVAPGMVHEFRVE